MKYIAKVLAIILICLTLTGCWDQNIYEKIGFILVTGFDKGEGDKTKFTFSTPIIKQSESESGGGGNSGGGEPQVDVFSTEANSVRESRDILRQASPKQLEGGKVQSLLFGNEFASEKKISETLEIYERDIQSTVQASVVIVDGNASEFISKGATLKGKPRLGFYLNDLVDRNFKAGYCPKLSIIKYNIINDIPGWSPILPIIKLDGDNIKVSGTALISNDKMTGRLDTRETACLFLALNETKLSEITFDLPSDIKTDKKKGSAFTRKVKTKRKVEFKDGMPVVNFTINLNASLSEYTWGHTDDPEYVKKLEDSLSKSIKACLEESFKKLQVAACDAYAIGDNLRAYHNGYWNSIGQLDGWKKIYPTIKANFNVKSNLVRFGEIK